MSEETLVSPVPPEALTKLMQTLESDAEARGWDQPARLYIVKGKPEDPDAQLVAEFTEHPLQVFPFLWEQGNRVKDFEDFLGVAYLHEAWRHPTFDEFVETEEAKAIKRGAKELFEGLTEEAIQEQMKSVYERMTSHIPPSVNPNHLEMRAVVAQFPNGVIANLIHDRGQEPMEVDICTEAERAKQCINGGTITSIVHRFINNLEPGDGEGDAWEAVEDARVCAALEQMSAQ